MGKEVRNQQRGQILEYVGLQFSPRENLPQPGLNLIMPDNFHLLHFPEHSSELQLCLQVETELGQRGHGAVDSGQLLTLRDTQLHLSFHQ